MTALTSIEKALRTPAEFRKYIAIDTDHGKKTLAAVMDPWQRRDFKAIDDSLKLVSRRGAYRKDAKLRAYWERPRGHDKTTSAAVAALFMLCSSKRMIRGVAAAADKDQARLIRDACAKIVHNNPWLRQLVEVQAHRVVAKKTGSEFEIISADAASSYGLTPDFVLVDEITHWGDGGEALWVSLFSAAAKVSTCFLIIIANAGVGEGTSWQWKLREATRTDPDWIFSRLDGPCASWISAKHLAEQRRLLPAVAFDRLWLNKWTSGAGDALTEADIQRAIRLPGPIPRNEFAGGDFFAGLDLGIKRDASSLVVTGVESGGNRARLAQVRSWLPPQGGQVNLQAIEDEVLELHREFGFTCNYDPWQAEHMAQRLRTRGVNMVGVPFSGQNLQRMASAIIETFSEDAIELFADDNLIADLRSLRIVEKSYGFKLDASRNQAGHADRATALALSLVGARDRLDSGGPPQVMVADPERVAEYVKKLQARIDAINNEHRCVPGDTYKERAHARLRQFIESD